MTTLYRYLAALLARCGGCLPDEFYLRLRYRLVMGHSLNLNSPSTFNEKLNWLKLYNRQPLYAQLVDKAEVKDWVKERIGKEHVIPTYGVWEHFDDIDFDTLPEPFVLKSTNGGGNSGVVICKDKSTLDLSKTRKLIERSMKTNWKYQREWVYYDVKPRIIAEKMLTDSNSQSELIDYKFFCFNGEPKLVLICKDRNKAEGMTEDFFTIQWEHLELKRPDTPNSATPIFPPQELNQMIEFARVLSKDIPFVRVDFYSVEHHIYFGELTFFPAGGMTPFEPEGYDKLLGSWLILPDKILVEKDLNEKDSY